MPDKMQQIGDRIHFNREPDHLRVEITQGISRRKESIFFAWLVALFVSFSAFCWYWFNSPEQSSDRIFFAVGAAFVMFFIVRYGKVFLWRKIGREILTIEKDVLVIKNAFGKRGKEERFDTQQIRKFGVIPYDFTKFGQFMDRAFWEMGGETMGFEHRNAKIRFGKQLEDQEVKQIARVIEKGLVEIPKRYRKSQKND